MCVPRVSHSSVLVGGAVRAALIETQAHGRMPEVIALLRVLAEEQRDGVAAHELIGVLAEVLDSTATDDVPLEAATWLNDLAQALDQPAVPSSDRMRYAAILTTAAGSAADEDARALLIRGALTVSHGLALQDLLSAAPGDERDDWARPALTALHELNIATATQRTELLALLRRHAHEQRLAHRWDLVVSSVDSARSVARELAAPLAPLDHALADAHRQLAAAAVTEDDAAALRSLKAALRLAPVTANDERLLTEVALGARENGRAEVAAAILEAQAKRARPREAASGSSVVLLVIERGVTDERARSALGRTRAERVLWEDAHPVGPPWPAELAASAEIIAVAERHDPTCLQNVGSTRATSLLAEDLARIRESVARGDAMLAAPGTASVEIVVGDDSIGRLLLPRACALHRADQIGVWLADDNDERRLGVGAFAGRTRTDAEIGDAVGSIVDVVLADPVMRGIKIGARRIAPALRSSLVRCLRPARDASEDRTR